MALSELEKAKSDDALGRILVAGLMDVLKHSIKSQVSLIGDDPAKALAAVERDLQAALEAHQIDPLTRMGYREGLSKDLRERLSRLLRNIVAVAASEMNVKPPPRAGSH